jgi:hypothetical protein
MSMLGSYIGMRRYLYAVCVDLRGWEFRMLDPSEGLEGRGGVKSAETQGCSCSCGVSDQC